MVNVGSFEILALYVDNILIASNNVNMLTKTKLMLLKHFELKDLRNASLVLGIEIHCDKSQGVLSMS